jgi:hypothetical protein
MTADGSRRSCAATFANALSGLSRGFAGHPRAGTGGAPSARKATSGAGGEESRAADPGGPRQFCTGPHGDGAIGPVTSSFIAGSEAPVSCNV